MNLYRLNEILSHAEIVTMLQTAAEVQFESKHVIIRTKVQQLDGTFKPIELNEIVTKARIGISPEEWDEWQRQQDGNWKCIGFGRPNDRGLDILNDFTTEAT